MTALQKLCISTALRRTLPSLFLCGAVCFFTPDSHAENDEYFDMPVEQLLSAHVVSASKRPEKVSDAPAAVYVISHDDIVHSGVTSIADALRMAPGVQVAQPDGNSWAVSIRGFNSGLSNKLLVMIDGRTVYNPVYAGTYWEAQDTLLNDIDRIEVIRGPGGTLWGANAVNGVINIITKQASETQGQYVSVSTGTKERAAASGRTGGALPGHSGYYRIYAKGFDRDSNDKPNGQDARDDWHSERSGFRVDWNNDFTLQGDVYSTQTNVTESLPTFTPPFAITPASKIDYTGANLLGHWQNKYDSGTLSTKSYIDYTRRDEPLLLKDEKVILDAEVQYDFTRWNRQDFIVGANYRYTVDDEGGTPGLQLTPSTRSDILYSVFGQDKITLVPERWFLTLGSKFEHNIYSEWEAQPNARLQWQPDNRQSVWTAVSKAVRTPSRLEQDLTFNLLALPGPSLIRLVNNDRFDSEDLTAYELGYRNQLTQAFSFDIATFYNNYDNLASFSPLPTSTVSNGVDPTFTLVPYQFVNGPGGKTYGAEIAASWLARKDLTLSGNYSIMNVDINAEPPGLVDVEPEGISPHQQAHLRALWTINPEWSLNSALYYVGPLEQYSIHGYVRMDMNLAYQIQKNLRFNLIGQNLLDESHQEYGSATSLNTAEIDRSVIGKLVWEF
jgi:iron complex outermembrane receptor protein